MAAAGGGTSAGAMAAEPPYAVKSDAAFFNLLDLQRPELAPLRQAVEANDWPEARRAWARHLEKREQPHWLWSRNDKAAITALYDKEFGGLARHIGAADQVLAHEFNFGGVRKKLAPQMEWYHGNLEWTHVLSRFEYWGELGRAYWATGKSVYAREFVSELEQWVAANPVPDDLSQMHRHGSRWRTLEAGVRGVNWFHAMEFFMDAPEFGVDAKCLMTRSLAEHGRYLFAKTHDIGYGIGNWQVCECSGLLAIGIMLPEFKDAPAWRATALRFLTEHMTRDVLPDGAHWELTPGYHTWVMKQFSETGRLCQLNGIAAPGLLDRHEKMFDFLLAFSKPDGRYPSVGDAGGGKSAIGPSMGLGALLYGRPDMRGFGPAKPEKEWLWTMGLTELQKYETLPAAPSRLGSVLLPDSQYAVMRTGWKPEDYYLLFDAAPWHGGHSHADALQLLLYAGRDLLVDSGMCSYDQPQAGALRKTAAHNVLMVDGREPSRNTPTLLAWQSLPEADFVTGELKDKKWTHQRSVLFVKPNYWVVMDYVLGKGPHEATRLFHFPADSGATAEGNQARTAFAKGMNLRIIPLDDARLEMRQGTVPTGAATFTQAPVAAFVTSGALPLVSCTVLIPYADAKELPVVEKMAASNPLVRKLCVKFPGGQRDEIAFAPEARPLHLSGQEGHGRAYLIRRGPIANATVELGATAP